MVNFVSFFVSFFVSNMSRILMLFAYLIFLFFYHLIFNGLHFFSLINFNLPDVWAAIFFRNLHYDVAHFFYCKLWTICNSFFDFEKFSFVVLLRKFQSWFSQPLCLKIKAFFARLFLRLKHTLFYPKFYACLDAFFIFIISIWTHSIFT